MNNKAHLRPKDFDSNGDIIPMACREEKGDLISREALKKKFERLVDETIPYGGVAVNDMRELIDNAPTIEIATKLQPNCNNLQQTQGDIIKAYTKGFDTGVETVKGERPQGERINTSPYDDKGECSRCCYLSKKYYKFCPNCGAQMKGD